MATLPVRNLGSSGLITDMDAQDIPINAFSDCRNVVFDQGSVKRSPGFKRIYELPVSEAVPWSSVSGDYNSYAYTWYGGLATDNADQTRHIASYYSPTNGAVLIGCNTDGSVYDYVNGEFEDVSPANSTTSSDLVGWTHNQISGLSVVNRYGYSPYIRDIISDANYSKMTVGDWPTTDYAVSMRTFKDFIIALNVYETNTQKHTMVKWTDPIGYRASKSTGVTWTSTSSNSAGSNILGQAKTPIEDGLALGNVFIIYTQTEAVLMEYTASTLVFNFRELFNDDGVINLNCVSEVGGQHYVFGFNNIYMHNGNAKQNLATNAVRDRIYNELDRSKASKFFVHYDNSLQLIYFCYVSSESDIGFANSTYCNKAAVYNMINQTWSFIDLPNVVGAASLNISTNLGLSSETTEMAVMVGARQTAINHTGSRAYALDMLENGQLSATQELETIKPAFVERYGLDLDETQAPLRSAKHLKTITPIITMPNTSGSLSIKTGFSEYSTTAPPTYAETTTYTPSSMYKLDSRANGRLLAYKVEEIAGNAFNFSGADFDITLTSRR